MVTKSCWRVMWSDNISLLRPDIRQGWSGSCSWWWSLSLSRRCSNASHDLLHSCNLTDMLQYHCKIVIGTNSIPSALLGNYTIRNWVELFFSWFCLYCYPITCSVMKVQVPAPVSIRNDTGLWRYCTAKITLVMLFIESVSDAFSSTRCYSWLLLVEQSVLFEHIATLY